MNYIPYVSVVIAIYNEEKYLPLCIDSLIKQDYPKHRYEIIFIDDNSKDKSSYICKNTIKKMKDVLPKIKYVRIKHSGLSVARNTGIYISNGDMIAFIDGDAVAHRSWINQLVDGFKFCENIGVVGGKIEVLNSHNWFSRFIHWIHYYKEDQKGEEIILIIGTNMMFRKSVFETVNGFFEQFKSRGDEHSFIDCKVTRYFKINTTKLAVVHHERPWNFLNWIKERFVNGYEFSRVQYVRKNYGKEYMYFLSYSVFRFFCFSFILWVPVVLLFYNLFILGISVISFCCFFYRNILRENIFSLFKILKREYNFAKTLYLLPLAIIIKVIGKIIDDYGYLKGIWINRNTKFSDSIYTSKQNIIEIRPVQINFAKKIEKTPGK